MVPCKKSFMLNLPKVLKMSDVFLYKIHNRAPSITANLPIGMYNHTHTHTHHTHTHHTHTHTHTHTHKYNIYIYIYIGIYIYIYIYIYIFIKVYINSPSFTLWVLLLEYPVNPLFNSPLSTGWLGSGTRLYEILQLYTSLTSMYVCMYIYIYIFIYIYIYIYTYIYTYSCS